jgi:GNAT superfamily N-acetyltransferase
MTDNNKKNGRMITLVAANEEHIDLIAPLIAKFRVALKRHSGIASAENHAAAREEYREYLRSGFPVYVAMDGRTCAGYLVCRLDEPCVWAESLYVSEEHRRRGVASLLYEKAEELAAGFGETTVYNWVHPNNDGMIAFLASRGYDVLNLIEIRRPYSGEKTRTRIGVGKHEFKY